MASYTESINPSPATYVRVEPCQPWGPSYMGRETSRPSRLRAVIWYPHNLKVGKGKKIDPRAMGPPLTTSRGPRSKITALNTPTPRNFKMAFGRGFRIKDGISTLISMRRLPSPSNFKKPIVHNGVPPIDTPPFEQTHQPASFDDYLADLISATNAAVANLPDVRPQTGRSVTFDSPQVDKGTPLFRSISTPTHTSPINLFKPTPLMTPMSRPRSSTLSSAFNNLYTFDPRLPLPAIPTPRSTPTPSVSDEAPQTAPTVIVSANCPGMLINVHCPTRVTQQNPSPQVAQPNPTPIPSTSTTQRSSMNTFAKLGYTPPTPPTQSASFGNHPTRKVAPLPRFSRVAAASKKILGFIHKPRGVGKHTILHLGDGRRVRMDWLPETHIPFEYNLIELEEAQQRWDIRFRMFPRPQPQAGAPENVRK